ncbi:DUF6880 family protein [Rhizobium sp. NPDC090275]|uniref:DUF6880 family protein n=1 Tax=Rhizobium sp. NPDC090275 TaxID=3364498 RepID=UPI00383AADC2
MAAKTTLNAQNLEALGVQRLAELLIELSTGSAAHQRRLRMELAGNHGSAELAREVRKRLSSIARAKTFINWRKVKATKTDLETQRKIIVETIASHDPVDAFELIWQFLAIADRLFERSDDGNGSLMQSFHQAGIDAGNIAKSAKIDADVLAEKVFKAIQRNGYGQFDRLLTAMAPALGHKGLEHVKGLFVDWSKEAREKPAQNDRQIIGWSSVGAIYEDDVYENHKDLTIRIALQEIADVQNDVDAYIAQQPEKTRSAPLVAADIANRLISAGRAEEALAALDNVEAKGWENVPFEWQLARTAALEALARNDEAQAFRWMCFEQSLNEEHLRAYVRRLPDFDDIEAEERAFAYAQAFPDANRGLNFFLRWPSPAQAAKLVLNRSGELDGDYYELMTPAAEMLSTKYPLAATIALRAMIDFTLDSGRSSRYKHAARHLTERKSLANQIEDFGKVRAHQDYLADLQREHGRKSGFWSLAS